MSKKRVELPELTPAQGEIMDIVWQRGEVSASEVRRVLSRTRAVARNTVRTLLERMEEKGWITHREDGRTFLYSGGLAPPDHHRPEGAGGCRDGLRGLGRGPGHRAPGLPRIEFRRAGADPTDARPGPCHQEGEGNAMTSILHDWYVGDRVLEFFSSSPSGSRSFRASAWLISWRLRGSRRAGIWCSSRPSWAAWRCPLLAGVLSGCGFTLVSIPILPAEPLAAQSAGPTTRSVGAAGRDCSSHVPPAALDEPRTISRVRARTRYRRERLRRTASPPYDNPAGVIASSQPPRDASVATARSPRCYCSSGAAAA